MQNRTDREFGRLAEAERSRERHGAGERVEVEEVSEALVRVRRDVVLQRVAVTVGRLELHELRADGRDLKHLDAVLAALEARRVLVATHVDRQVRRRDRLRVRFVEHVRRHLGDTDGNDHFNLRWNDCQI